MRGWVIGSAVLLAIATSASAKGLPSDDAIIRYMKAYPVAKIDPRLGNTTYEAWIAKTLGPWKSISWEVDDCGEEGEGSIPLCVSTDVRLDECRHVGLSVVVGSMQGGISGVPMAWSIERSGVTPTDDLDSLAQLEPAMKRARDLEESLTTRPLAPIDTLAAIRFAKEIKVTKRANPSSMTLEDWIASLAGSQSQVTWALVGCDATVTSYQLKGCDDFWACVHVSVDNPLENFGVTVRVGTFRRGILGEPQFHRPFLWNKRINRANYFLPDLPALEAQLDSIRQR